jgi:hypothetical protein
VSELRLSADGFFYWDGEKWVSTLSPDGRFRWNGTSWVPIPLTTPTFYGIQAPARVPTAWTLPLQYGVAGYHLASALWALSLPFWIGGAMDQLFNQVIQNQQQFNPEVSPPPAQLTSLMSGVMTGSLWLGAIIAIVFASLAIIGAVRRWTWAYWGVLVLLGLNTLGLPFRLINTASTSGLYSQYSLPAPVTWANIVFGVASAVIFVAMLIAIIARGPWGMIRPSAAASMPG